MRHICESMVSMVTGILRRLLFPKAAAMRLRPQAPSMVVRVLLAGIVSVIACVADGDTVEARVWNVYIDGSGDAPFIQAAVDSARNGDIVQVGPGSYPEPYVSIEDKSIEVRSSHGPAATTVKHFYTYEAQPDPPDNRIVLSGFTMEGGGQNTGGFAITRCGDVTVADCIIRGYEDHSTIEATPKALVVDCLFEDNVGKPGGPDGGGGGALNLRPFVHSPGIEVVGCVFRDNTGPGGVVGEGAGGGGAIAVSDYGEGTEVTIRDCLFEGNQSTSAGAIFATGYVWIVHNTFIDNSSQDGAVVSAIATSHGVFHNVFAFNSQYAIWDVPVSHCGCNAFWQNERGDGSTGCAEPEGSGNFGRDPEFCDSVRGDYRLRESSPLTGPFNDPAHANCEAPIGAFGAGCGSTPVGKGSWGSIKARYSVVR